VNIRSSGKPSKGREEKSVHNNVGKRSKERGRPLQQESGSPKGKGDLGGTTNILPIWRLGIPVLGV